MALYNAINPRREQLDGSDIGEASITLQHDIYNVSDRVYVSGVALVRTVGYTVVGRVITFTVPLITGQTAVVHYLSTT